MKALLYKQTLWLVNMSAKTLVEQIVTSGHLQTELGDQKEKNYWVKAEIPAQKKAPSSFFMATLVCESIVFVDRAGVAFSQNH